MYVSWWGPAVAAAVIAVVCMGDEAPLRAQGPAPGGVSSGLLAWQKADVSGATNTSWPDSSGTSHTASSPGTALRSGSHARAINFNPTYDFTSGNYFLYSDALGISGLNTFSTLVVTRRDSAITEIYFGSNQGQPTYTAHLTATGAYGGGTSGSGSNGTCGFATTTTTPVLVPAIGSVVRTSNSITGRLNGGGSSTQVCTESYVSSGRVLGRRFLTNQNSFFFAGVMPEFIEYTRALTTTEVQQVQSYLAVKYGITLDQATPQNYIDSTTAVVWDATVNATYKNNIAGIGRDDASALVQRQSQSVNTANSGNLVTLGLSTITADNASNPNNFAADRNFLIWGDDGASTSFATPITTPTVGTSTRMTRTWRVQETGTVPTVKVAVPTTVASGALVYLVVSNDSTFDNTDQWVPMAPLSAGSASYLAADVDFTTGQYFTIAMVSLTDLAITKSDTQASYVPGKPIGYSIVVTNVGPTNATGVSVTDVVPSAITGLTVNCTAAGSAACGTNASSGNTASFTGASVAAGAGNQLTIAVNGTVNPGATGNLINTATVAAGTGQSDPNTANNAATDTDTPAQADVSITKTGPAAATPGGDITYTMTVTNNGPDLAAAVSITDPTPPALTFVANAGACTTAFPCALGDLTSGATRTITTTYHLPSNYTAPNPIVNTATVATITADPNSANNASTVSTPLGAAQSDLQIVKNVSAAAVLPGQNYTYTLQVTNNGPSDATNVRATDMLPAQAAFQSSVAGCTAAGQLVTCPTIPTMAVGALASFDIVVRLDPGYAGNGSDLLNSGVVTSDTLDPTPQNNTNPAGAPPVGPPGADVTLVKTVSADPVAPGQTFTYNLLVSNQGPSAAADVVVTDPLPGPMTFVSSPQGCTAVGQDVTCPTLATLAPGGFTTFTLIVRLDPAYAGNGSDLGNRATVASTTPDPVPGNDTTSPVPPNLASASADLSTAKVAIGTSVAPGQTFTYRITVTNAGPSAAQSVTATDTLPGPLHFVSSPQGCTAAGQVVTCTQPLLAPGATATFDLLVQLDAGYVGNGSDIGNIATATTTTPDPNPTNNTTPQVPPPPFVVGSADLTVDKSGPVGSVPAGGEITYTLVVTNQGPNAATDVVVEDPTPSGLTFIATTGDCTTPFPCALGTILQGLTKTIVVRYAVAPGVNAISNTATVSSSAADPKLSNNSATVLTPTPAQRYYFSEGSTGGFFDYDLLIANPNTQSAPVTLNFFREDGSTITQSRTVDPQSRLTVHVDDIPGLEEAATSVVVSSDSGVPLAVERTMFWDHTYYAGHTGTAVTAPATKWYFAEGFQGYFSTFVLLENPGAVPADVTVTFLRESEAPYVKQVPVPPFTRVTVDAFADAASLFGRGFGIVVDATQPVVAERSMYFGTTPARFWSGGHSSAGVTEPTWRWFLAEGATGSFFDLWILLSNPQTVDAHVTIDYQLEDGTVISVPKIVPAQRRLTISVDQEDDQRLHDAAVSARVSSDVPIIAERSMYWGSAPDANPWSEGHNSFGMTESALRWAVAEGRVGGPLNYHTYLLLANPQTASAEVTVTYLRENGASPIVKTYTVPATTRFNIDVNSVVPELKDESFGALIEVTNGVTIAVERSMYWDANGVFWSGGTNSPGTKLP